jgi:glucodextranase-like protein/PASTA domain-containing protein
LGNWVIRRGEPRHTWGVLVALALVLGGAAPASAAGFTAATFTGPPDGANLFYDTDSGSGSVTVSGTVTGTSASSRGELRCYNGIPAGQAGGTAVLATNVDVSGGAFGLNVSLAPVSDQVCRLALVPVGTGPSADPPPGFAGPAISVTGHQSDSWNGELYGYSILAGTFSQSFSLGSAGECAVRASYQTTSPSQGTFTLFTHNACLGQAAPGAPSPGRSELQIDGQNAYLPGAVGPTIDAQGKVTSDGLTGQPGFQPLTYDAAFDAAHDGVLIDDTETPMLCVPPASYPPTPAGCPSLRDSGIRIHQQTALLPGGSVARVIQTITDVDGHPHQLDVDFEQDVGDAQRNTGTPGFQFPGQSALAPHGTPDTFSGWAAGPQSIFVIRDAAAAPAPQNPVGAITFNHPPQSARFVTAPGATVAKLLMGYQSALGAGGSVVYDWSFSQATSAAGASWIEAAERDRMQSPVVLIATPANHTRTTASRVLVHGGAGDGVGIRSLTVDGRPTALSGAAFTASVALRLGVNSINVTAVNDAGNATTATLVLTRVAPPCRVPRLAGRTLTAARRALSAAHCGLGSVTSSRSRRVRRGLVISSRPGSGSVQRPGTKVRLVLSQGR